MPEPIDPTLTFPFMTRPATGGAALTTFPKYRGTKTADELAAEIQARLTAGSLPLTIPNVLRALGETIIDWTIAGWKIDPIGDDAIGFLCGSGGSNPIGTPEDWNFETMEIDLRGYYGKAGRQRARDRFHADKVGAQNRVAPVFAEVYDSATKAPNHYVAGGDIVVVLANRAPRFDPSGGCSARFRKPDGTWVPASGYPYYKGKTIVIGVPTGLTGEIQLELSVILSGGVKTGLYEFPLT